MIFEAILSAKIAQKLQVITRINPRYIEPIYISNKSYYIILIPTDIGWPLIGLIGLANGANYTSAIIR